MNILRDKYFKTVFWVAKSYMAICFNYFLRMAIFLNIDISQGSVATYLRCGGIFTYEFVANVSLSLLAKEFWKSVNIWGSCGQEFSVLFFDSRCSYRYVSTYRSLLFLVSYFFLLVLVIRWHGVVIRTGSLTRCVCYWWQWRNFDSYLYQLVSPPSCW